MSALRIQAPENVSDDLYSLSQGPDERYGSWNNCIVNGVRFRSKHTEELFRTQCSGVSTVGVHNGEDITFYGTLLEVMELLYKFDRKVLIFRCKWFNSDPNCNLVIGDHNLTSINTTSNWYTGDPYILASQARQVFYLPDLRRGRNWRIVQKVSSRTMFDVLEKDDVDDENVGVDDDADDDFDILPLMPVEDNVDPSSLVRNDVMPIHYPDRLFVDLNIEGPSIIFDEDEDEGIDEEFEDENEDDSDEIHNGSDESRSSDDESDYA